MSEHQKHLLRNAGFRATQARLHVLFFLEKQDRPVGIDVIHASCPEINLTTLYRIMNDFEAAKLVQSHELGHGHQDYELTSRPHHHHLVCDTCGAIEDVYACESDCDFGQKILASSKRFASLTRQSTTFFGLCKSCT